MAVNNDFFCCDLIKLNQTVILEKGNVLKAVKLVPDKLIVFEKLRFKPENAVGQKYGTLFNVKNLMLIPVTSATNNDIISASSSGKDNRSIEKLLNFACFCLLMHNWTTRDIGSIPSQENPSVLLSLTDTYGKSQGLQRCDLLQLKADGASGEQIVQNLVKNSTSFAEKTSYSQDKYLKRKQKKYLSYLKMHKPTARLICKLYEEREPAKICHMRMDSMSQLLACTNIRSGSKVAVFETCSGVIMGMILERLGGQGCVVNFHVGETPANIFAIAHFNFPDSYWDIMHPLPLHKLAPFLSEQSFESTFSCIQPNCQSNSNNSSSAVSTAELNSSTDSKKTDINGSIPTNLAKGTKRKHDLTQEEKAAVRAERQRKRFEHQKQAWNYLETRDLDAVIVASKYHPTPIVLALLDVLAPSKPFAVYFEHKEPLMELFVRLSTSNSAINLQLTDTFMRKYQVLPERTHPVIAMPGNSGYLLTGIKVK